MVLLNNIENFDKLNFIKVVNVKKRIHIFTGHFGSGKTEIAINYALQLAKAGKKTIIVDCDIVNTYFRTLDAKSILEENNIKVIAPTFANTNLEMQMMPSEVLSVFEKKDTEIVFDVGGDEDGAFALGGLKRFFEREGYDMYFVVNTCRPLTDNVMDTLVYMDEIERASRLNITHIINNANLAGETVAENLYLADRIVREIAEKTRLEYSFVCGMPEILEKLDKSKLSCKEFFEIKRFLKLDF